MSERDLHFVIPTYRLRDVGATVEAYDENFARSGQTAPIIVFDDSSVANHDKYFGALEATSGMSARPKRSSSSPPSASGCATASSTCWFATSSAPAMAAIATSP